MAKLTKILTPRGTAMYPHVRKPEFYQGAEVGYTVQLQLSKEDTAKLAKRLEAELEAAKGDSAFKGKRWSKEPNMGMKYDKNDDIYFKFKTSTNIKTKTGEIIPRNIPVFDAHGNPFKGDFGHGSIIRVRFSVNPYWMSSSNNGLSLYLDAVQVIKYVEPGSAVGNAEAYGFEKEDGFDVKENEYTGDENPFNNDDDGDDF